MYVGGVGTGTVLYHLNELPYTLQHYCTTHNSINRCKGAAVQFVFMTRGPTLQKSIVQCCM